MGYQEAVEDLENRLKKDERSSREKVEEVLEELGRPDEDYNVVLVGGTNGKGSTTEMISEMLQSQGFNVGKFKSPHLTSLRERISVDSEHIPRDELLQLYRKLRDRDLAFFEFMTVLAYQYFSDREVDYAVMEVVMGGKEDSTNASDPELSVITNIELDHTEHLGETRDMIAREKAGILPENGPIVTRSDLDPITEKAEERESEIVRPEETRRNDRKLIYRDEKFSLPVRGSYQYENLELALKAVEKLEKLPDSLERSLSELSCPGRMEKVSEKPEIILDGAHNVAAVEKIIGDLPENFVCVFSSCQNKNYQEMISCLEMKASKFVFTRPDFRKLEEPGKLAQETSESYEVAEDLSEALETALSHGKPIVVTGSLYLVGEFKQREENLIPLKTWS